jgi:hypothetical protein
MNRKIGTLLILLLMLLTSTGLISAGEKTGNNKINTYSPKFISDDEYGIQWEMSYGSNSRYGARYEGPQPIGDCDNDGDNELLIGGRDAMLRVYEWSDSQFTYLQTHTLRCPFFPLRRLDADGFAIGDLTGDGNNEIAVSWYATIHKWIAGKYRIIGWNPWIEWHGGGTPDCYIGDCNNDGQNELILSCRDWTRSVPEIVVFKWNGWRLVKVAHWNDPGINGEVFMAGMGDTDQDGENEIVLGSGDKVVVLDWNKETEEFVPTIILDDPGSGWEHHPFACVCKDSDMDGKDEIHVGYYAPRITIFEWNGEAYEIKFEHIWPGEGLLIEGLDVGDVDDDGLAEVCAGTDVVHILQWNGDSYVEEALLKTFGDLAVVCIGDCDNDGKNEINAGSVIVQPGQDFMSWVFKYGWKET